MSSEADRLLAALAVAADDAARLALLAAAAPEVREQLAAECAYRAMLADSAAHAAAFDAFAASLCGAADDAERLRIIEAARSDPQRGDRWLSEWQWWRGASPTDCALRYLGSLLPTAAPAAAAREP